MAAFLPENSRSVLMSVLLHGGIVAALLLAANFSLRPRLSVQPLPVDATVVDSRIVRAAEHAKRNAALKAQAAAAARQQQAEQAQQADQARAAQQAREAEQAQEAEQAREAQQAREAAQARAAKQAQAVRAQEKASAAAAAAAVARADEAKAANRALQAKKAAETKRAAEAKRVAEAKRAADAKHLADARARAALQADLRRQIAAEEHAEAVQRGPLADQYRASLANRIIHAWIKPPTARLGVDCRVEVTQVPGGEVTSARVTACNGDAAVRQSIENAVYRASPLPDPPDPALFQRVFVFEFKPDE